MTDTATADVRPTPAAPAPAAAADKYTAPPPATDILFDDDLEGDEPAAETTPAGDGKQDAEGEPVERPAWARPADEESAEAWREERNIPADPDDYELPVDPDQLDDTGRQTIEGFTKLSHELDLPQESASKMFKFAETRAQEIMAARVEQDRAEAGAAKEALFEQWGDGAKANLRSVTSLLKGLPADLSKAVREARVSNGLGGRLANNPAFLQMMAHYAALKAGDPAVGIFDGQADGARIKAIELTRRNNIDDYFKQDMHLEIEKLMQRKAARAPAGPAPTSKDAAREAEILKVMKSNFQEYERLNLGAELAAIRARRGAN